MIVLVAAVTAVAVACALTFWLPFFVADEAGMRILRHRPRLWRSDAVLIASGVLLAVIALLAFEAVTSAEAPVTSATAPTTVTVICVGLGIGAAAGATPLLAWIDLRIHRLPDRIMLPLLGLTAMCWGVAALSGGDARSGGGALVPLGHSPGVALVIGAVCGVVVLVVSLIGGRGRGLAIGLGDVKLAVLVGALTALAGTSAVLAAFVLAQCSAFIDAGWRILIQRQGLAARLAYGPHLLLGMWTGPLVHALLR